MYHPELDIIDMVCTIQRRMTVTFHDLYSIPFKIKPNIILEDTTHY